VVVDVGLALPRIFILLMAVALWDGLPFVTLALAIGLTSWFGTSRLCARGGPLAAQRDFVVRRAGAGRRRWPRYLSPRSAGTPPRRSSCPPPLGVGNVLLLEASLSFLGIGVAPPRPSWAT